MHENARLQHGLLEAAWHSENKARARRSAFGVELAEDEPAGLGPDLGSRWGRDPGQVMAVGGPGVG